MFISSSPPMLVQPINMRHTTLFHSHEGYCIHFLSETQALVSYKDGWTIPLSGNQQRFVTAPPLFLLKESGGITSASSTVTKGYAHQFCQDDGTEPVLFNNQTIILDRPDEKWMLIPNTITMVWLQYGKKDQYCGETGHEIERICFGKLLIRKFDIKEDFAPRLGKDATDPVLSAKQYRVYSRQLYKESWTLANQDAHDYLMRVLTSQKLERFQAAVTVALKRAGHIN